MAATIKTCECPKCGGSGYIPEYSGIAGGVCFKCNGAGKIAWHPTKVNKLSPINAMHCGTVGEAEVFRLGEFAKRFPELAGRLTPEMTTSLKRNGMVKYIVAELTK